MLVSGRVCFSPILCGVSQLQVLKRPRAASLAVSGHWDAGDVEPPYLSGRIAGVFPKIKWWHSWLENGPSLKMYCLLKKWEILLLCLLVYQSVKCSSWKSVAGWGWWGGWGWGWWWWGWKSTTARYFYSQTHVLSVHACVRAPEWTRPFSNPWQHLHPPRALTPNHNLKNIKKIGILHTFPIPLQSLSNFHVLNNHVQWAKNRKLIENHHQQQQQTTLNSNCSILQVHFPISSPWASWYYLWWRDVHRQVPTPTVERWFDAGGCPWQSFEYYAEFFTFAKIRLY